VLASRVTDEGIAVEGVSKMGPMVQSVSIDGFADEHILDLFAQLESPTQARLLDDGPAEVAQRLLASLGEHERNVAARILGYPDDSVGRRMTVVAQELTRDMTAATALNIIRDVAVADYEVNDLTVLPVGSTTHKV